MYSSNVLWFSYSKVGNNIFFEMKIGLVFVTIYIKMFRMFIMIIFRFIFVYDFQGRGEVDVFILFNLFNGLFSSE